MTETSPIKQETLNELQDIIDNAKPLSEQEQIARHDELKAHLQSPEAQKELLDEIKKLGQYSVDIEKGFADIEQGFARFDTSKVPEDLKNDVKTLADNWKSYRKAYVDLLWESRDVASKASAAAKDFTINALPYLQRRDVPVTSKRTEINGIIKILDKETKLSQSLSSNFTDLSKNVDNFKIDWQDVLKKHNTDALTEQIATLDKEIAEINSTINELNRKLNICAVALGILGGGTIGFFILGFICPIWWFHCVACAVGTAILASSFDKFNAEQEQAIKDRGKKQAERDEKAAALELIPKLQAELDNSTATLASISTKLVAFGHVWAMIRAQLQEISDKLGFVKGTDTEELFYRRLETTKLMYEKLIAALTAYQVAVKLPEKL